MKKYLLLLAVTAAAIGGITALGGFAKGLTVPVSVVELIPIPAENSVICSGKVERTETKNIYAPSAAVAREIYVEPGDYVEKGDTIMVVSPVTDQEKGSTSSWNIPEQYRDAFQDYAASEASQALESQEKQENTEITAPFSGEITSVLIQDQGCANPENPVAVIADTTGLQVRLSVSESRISEIKEGQRAEISGVGFDSVYYGTVSEISGEAKQTTSISGQETVVEVIVQVDGEAPDMKPGFTARTKIITSEEENVLIVPYEAVQADEDGNEFVYRISEDGRAVYTPVKTGREFEEGFEILEGLQSYDTIIEDGEDIHNGTRVMIAEAKAVGAQ